MVSVQDVSPTFDNLTISAEIAKGGNILLSLFTSLIALASIIFVIWAGYLYITSQGDPKKVETARSTLINAVIGIIIVTTSYTVVRFGKGLSGILNTVGAPGVRTVTPRPPTPTPRPGSSVSLAEFKNGAWGTYDAYGYEPFLGSAGKYCYNWRDPTGKPENCLDTDKYDDLGYDIADATSKQGVIDAISNAGASDPYEWICRRYKEDRSTDCPFNNR